MRTLSVKLSTLSPLAIRADHAPTGAEMIGYIPGTTFVGGLAAVHRALLYENVEEFARFFLSDKVHFSDLYPANFEELAKNTNVPVYPVSRTAISCKRHPGFKPKKPKADAGHGVEDSLYNWTLLALSRYEPKFAVLKELEKQKRCKKCEESMDRLSGYYRRFKEVTNESEQVQCELAQSEFKRLQTRTGINRETGTVEESILYNRMVFEENVKFWGQITLPDDDELYEDLDTFLEKTSKDNMLRLGTGRTRGLGKIAMSVEEIDDGSTEEKRFKGFQDRLTKFNKFITTRAKTFSLLNSSNDYFFAVTLHSPLMLSDELLRYKGKLDEKALNEALGMDIPDLHLMYQNAGMKRVTGWNELWGTPKTNEYAIEAGSVFLFRCSGQPDEKIQRKLFQLEEQGLGKRRAEGFGRICISDDFHSEEQQS